MLRACLPCIRRRFRLARIILVGDLKWALDSAKVTGTDDLTAAQAWIKIEQHYKASQLKALVIEFGVDNVADLSYERGGCGRAVTGHHEGVGLDGEPRTLCPCVIVSIRMSFTTSLRCNTEQVTLPPGL